MSVATPDRPEKALNDPALKAALQDLRRTDNWRNWWYVLRTYLFLGLAIGGAVIFFENREAWDLSFWWDVPVAIAAIVLVGAGQHQLSGLAHEGAHHILFRNRTLNELASDLLPCSRSSAARTTTACNTWPTTSSSTTRTATRTCRNCRRAATGCRSRSPGAAFVQALLKQLWLPNLVRFIRVRAAYNATGTDKNPYLIEGPEAVEGGRARRRCCTCSPWSARWPALLLQPRAAPAWRRCRPRCGRRISVVYCRLPADKFHQSRVHPVIPQRYMTMLRVGFITAAVQRAGAGSRSDRRHRRRCITSCCGWCRCSRRSRSS